MSDYVCSSCDANPGCACAQLGSTPMERLDLIQKWLTVGGIAVAAGVLALVIWKVKG